MNLEIAHQKKYPLMLITFMLWLSILACSNMLFIDNKVDCDDVGGTWNGSTCYTPGESDRVDGKTDGDGGDSEESILQDGGNSETIDEDEEEESINIPTGTYIGWMFVDLSMTKCVFEDLGTQVTVEVADNGTVTGEMSNKFTLTCIEREGCIPKGETTYISFINGQITETNNTVEIHETHSFRNIVRCGPPEDYTEENTFVAEIRVSGDEMTCTIPGDGNRLYFRAKKR